jgi:hypothetical protein
MTTDIIPAIRFYWAIQDVVPDYRELSIKEGTVKLHR